MDLRGKSFVFILLVLYFTMTVFADLKQDVENLHDNYKNKIAPIMNSLKSIVEDELENAKTHKGLIGSSCLPKFPHIQKKNVDPKYILLDQCRDDTKTNKNLKSAEECYSQTIATLNKEADNLHTTVTDCIKTCTGPRAHLYPVFCQ